MRREALVFGATGHKRGLRAERRRLSGDQPSATDEPLLADGLDGNDRALRSNSSTFAMRVVIDDCVAQYQDSEIGESGVMAFFNRAAVISLLRQKR